MLVSGRPDNIDAFAEAGGGVARLVQEEAAELGGALDAFRATEGWNEYLGDVPPLDVDLGAAGGMVALLASRAGTFASDLRTADLVSVDGITYAVGLFAAWDDLGEVASAPVLVQDGDRWILAGTVDADHVRLQRSADGSYEAVVTTVRPDGSTVTHTVAITAEQAGDLVIHVGAGNDVIEVPAGAELSIVMWGGDGDDLLGAGREGPLAGVGGGGDDTIFGGAGDDVVYAGGGDDAVYGGEGTDDLDGQDGNDTIAGGDDADQVHGGRGDDVIVGGRGDDSLDGGSGRDDVDGGAGDDVVVGGRGEDVVAGGAGDDRLLGGRDHDVIVGGSGDDSATMEDGELGIGAETRVTLALTGSPGDYAIELVRPYWMSGAEWDAYLERIDSDLEFIRSTEVGRQGLTALDAAARDSDSGWKPGDRDRRVRIYPYGDDESPMMIDPDGSAGPEPERVYTALDWMSGRTNPQDSSASPPGGALEHDGLVSYSQARPGIYDSFQPAATVLYHELAHSHDQISGGTPGGTYEEHWVDPAGNPVDDAYGDPHSEFNNAEWNAVGHDIDGDGDFDTLETGGGREHPGALTENAIRRELGLPPPGVLRCLARRRPAGRVPRDGGVNVAVCSSRTLLALLLAGAVAAGCGDDDPAVDGDSSTEEEEAVSDPTTTEAGREIFAGATLTLSDRRADRVTLTVTAGVDATIAVVDALVSERHTEPADGGERVLYLRPPPGTSPGDAQTEVAEVLVVGAGDSLALPSPGGITPATVEICVEVVPYADPSIDRQTGDTDLVGRGTIPTQLVCATLGEG